MNNYPDNIRDYDNNPGSPFYEPEWFKCKNCDTMLDPDDYEEGSSCDDCQEEVDSLLLVVKEKKKEIAFLEDKLQRVKNSTELGLSKKHILSVVNEQLVND